MLISQDSIAIDIYRRVEKNWVLNSYKSAEKAILESVKLELSVDQVYVEAMGKL